MTKLVCKFCGSADVAVKVWQNPNTGEVIHDADENDRAWCDKCEDFTKLISIESD